MEIIDRVPILKGNACDAKNGKARMKHTVLGPPMFIITIANIHVAVVQRYVILRDSRDRDRLKDGKLMVE